MEGVAGEQGANEEQGRGSGSKADKGRQGTVKGEVEEVTKVIVCGASENMEARSQCRFYLQTLKHLS